MFSADRYVAALTFAAHHHRDQKVPGTEFPYIVHVVSVAAELIASLPSAGIDGELAVTCALLHDTIEDTAATYDEVLARFGSPVADGVRALSKDEALSKEQRMADSLRRIRDQPHAVWAVKLADRITNLAPPPRHWTRDKCRAYRDEAVVIADALGAASPTLEARIRARIEAYSAYA